MYPREGKVAAGAAVNTGEGNAASWIGLGSRSIPLTAVHGDGSPEQPDVDRSLPCALLLSVQCWLAAAVSSAWCLLPVHLQR